MAAREIAHPSPDESRAAGKGARERTPPSSPSSRSLAKGRHDPVTLPEEQDLTLGPGLMPVGELISFGPADVGRDRDLRPGLLTAPGAGA
jgi:hypothetical protein